MSENGKREGMFYVAVYIRLSREDGDKEESDSVGNQKKLLTEYVAQREDFILHDLYVDDGYSGTNFDRPDFHRMLEDMKAGKVNCVVVKDLSRFGRDYIETGRYLERYFPELGVRFISVTDGIDSRKQAYDMLLPIKNIFNEQYARDISKKIQATVKSKQRAGEFIGAFASYGYRKSPANKNKLIVDEYAAGVVRRIFSLYIQGYGKQRIAKLLNAEGILCPSEYKRVNGENYRNSNCLGSTTYWSYSTVNSILHREMYVGNMVQGTKHQPMRSRQKKMPKEDWIIVKNTHEPIVDRATWEKAQSLLKKRSRELDLETNKNVFAGFVKCGDCGRAMVKSAWRRADGSKTYCLYCGTYKRNGKGYCTPHMIPVSVLEDIVLGDLKTLIKEIGDLGELVRARGFGVLEAKKTAFAQLDKVKAELERIRRFKKSIYEDYRDGVLAREEFLSYREDYLRKEKLYSRQVEALEERKKEEMTEDVFQRPWLKKLLEQKEVEALDREIVTEMIDEIKIYENHRIKITYNFGKFLYSL